MLASAGLPKTDLYLLLECLIHIFIGRCCLLLSAIHILLSSATHLCKCLYEVMNFSSGRNWIRNERVLLEVAAAEESGRVQRLRTRRLCDGSRIVWRLATQMHIQYVRHFGNGTPDLQLKLSARHRHSMFFTLHNVKCRTSVIASAKLFPFYSHFEYLKDNYYSAYNVWHVPSVMCVCLHIKHISTNVVYTTFMREPTKFPATIKTKPYILELWQN